MDISKYGFTVILVQTTINLKKKALQVIYEIDYEERRFFEFDTHKIYGNNEWRKLANTDNLFFPFYIYFIRNMFRKIHEYFLNL